MKKELKDYLHFYIGQIVSADGNEFELRGVEYSGAGALACNGLVIDGISQGWWIENCDFKICLRPVSSITKDELKEVVFLFFGKHNEDIISQTIGEVKMKPKEPQDRIKYGTSIPYSLFKKDGSHYATATFATNSLNPQQFQYLISKGFDLFELIDTGLAIDKTKIN